MAEECSVVTITYKPVALAPTWEWRAAPPTENSSTSGSTESIHGPSLQPLWPTAFILFILPYSQQPHHLVTSSCIIFLSFPTQESGPYRGHEWMFSKDMVPQLWTHNSIHFPADRKIILVAVLVTDMLIMQVSVNPVPSTLSEVIPTMNFLTWESQEWAVNSSVHLVSKMSTIKRQSYIKCVSLKPQVLLYHWEGCMPPDL